MAKQERSKKSTVSNKARAFQDVQRAVEPWHELDEDERRLFDALIHSREVSTWLPADIEAATALAQVGVEMQRCWQQLQEEGRTVVTDKGWASANPLIAVYAQLSGLYQKHRTALGLTASQRGVSGNKQAGRNLEESDIRGKVGRSSGANSML